MIPSNLLPTLLTCEISLYNPSTFRYKMLYQIYALQMYLISLCLVFSIFLKVYFEEQKFLMLINPVSQSYTFVVLFVICAFVSFTQGHKTCSMLCYFLKLECWVYDPFSAEYCILTYR
jgi:fucose 4-O-acetylase-like acetyltransferase